MQETIYQEDNTTYRIVLDDNMEAETEMEVQNVKEPLMEGTPTSVTRVRLNSDLSREEIADRFSEGFAEAILG